MTFGLTTSYGQPAKAQAVLDQYPIDSTVNVYYDPNNPAEAVLERKAGGKVIGLVIGILFLFLSLCVACHCWSILVYSKFYSHKNTIKLHIFHNIGPVKALIIDTVLFQLHIPVEV